MMSFSTDSKSSLNILVIDGSCEITNMLMRVLFCTGHCAKAFNNPIDALAFLEQSPDEFDAIITDDFLNDTEMEMTGNVLIEALLEKSKLPILVWSTQIDTLKAVILDTSFLSFLHKPQDLKNIFAWLGNIKNTVIYKEDSAPIYQLIYASKVSDEFCEQDLMDILYISRKFNKLRNISGALIYHNHCFLQVLEGGEHEVKTLFNTRCSSF
jgi:DNA-binding NtrC family response regulator